MRFRVGHLDEVAKRMEAMSNRMEQGVSPEPAATDSDEDAASLPAIAPDDLKALLPASLPGGFAQSEMSTSTGGAAGFSFGAAEAVYNKGDARIKLSLMDMGVTGAFAALGSAFGVNATEETETSYSKMGQVDGRMVIEEFNRETKTGKYAIVIGDRVMIEAEGSGASMDELENAVQEVDIGRVEALAK